jgi:parvulin-like peptidyl-prolyl isomerase
MRSLHGLIPGIFVLLLFAACEEPFEPIALPVPPPGSDQGAQESSPAPVRHAAVAPSRGRVSTSRTLASLRARAVTWQDLGPSLLELAGGKALAEHLIDEELRDRLRSRNLSVDPAQLRSERNLFTEAVSTDPQEAARLMTAVQREQRLGEHRLRKLMWRNAALRMLVQDQVEVPDAVIRKAYDYEYGTSCRVRLIVVDSLDKASRVIQRAKAGESFSDLAVRHSTDPSRAQGGLLDPIRPGDTSWPAAVRNAVAGKNEGAITDPVVLPSGYGIMKIEQLLAGQDVAYEAVKDALHERARRGVERMQMHRLAREILAEADSVLIISDPALRKSWLRQRKLMLGEGR